MRDLVRYRAKIAQQRVSEIARLGGVLQDAGIKIDSVASSIATQSGRAMIEALVDGERRGAVLADLAKGRMRSKIPDLWMALEGRFGEHHAMMCRLHLDHIAYLEKTTAELDARIEAMMQPFRAARDLLTTIPGIGAVAAAAVISEIGPDPRQYFPTVGHLASWAGLCPGNHESAGKRLRGKRRHGNIYLQPVLVEIAWNAVRHDGYLKSLYHRHVTRNGGYRSSAAKNKAITTVAHAILVIIWNMLSTSSTALIPTARPAASSPASRHSASTSPSTTPPDPSSGQPAHKPPSAQNPCPQLGHSRIRRTTHSDYAGSWIWSSRRTASVSVRRKHSRNPEGASGWRHSSFSGSCRA